MAALSALLGWLLLIALLGVLVAHPVGQLVLASGVVALLVWVHRTRPELAPPRPKADWVPTPGAEAVPGRFPISDS